MHMELLKRDMARDNWAGALRHREVCRLTRQADFSGVLGLMQMQQVEKPLIFNFDGRPVRVVDNGFYWLQMAPAEGHWWLTVMYDTARQPVQAYFDITGENHILPDGASWFTDLFLDVVFMPDGRMHLLDEDELEQALREGVVTRAQYDAAQRQAAALLRGLEGHAAEFFFWTGRHFLQMLPLLPED